MGLRGIPLPGLPGLYACLYFGNLHSSKCSGNEVPLIKSHICDSQSVRQECMEGSKRSAPDRSYSYGPLSKGSFHARLDTSVIGHGAGFYCLSIKLHMERVHIVKMNLEIKCLPLDSLWLAWSLPVCKLKIPCMQWIKASVMTKVMDPGNFHSLWLHAESLFVLMCTACT